MSHVHEETIDGVTYRLYVESEDIPIRGNAMASGDDDADKALEDELIERLDRGDDWAWFCAKVTATIEGIDAEGTDYLGACSYSGLQEFLHPDGYWPGMRDEARARLVEDLQRLMRESRKARAALKRLGVAS